MDALLLFLKENWGTIIAIAGVVSTFFFFSIRVTWHSSKWKNNVDDKLKELEPVRTGFQSMSDKVEDLWKYFLRDKVTGPGSPLTLTNLGKEISKCINAKELVKEYLPELIKSIKSDTILSAFDIQDLSVDFATQVLMSLLLPGQKDLIKNEAFVRGIALEKILEVMSIEFRDAWLEKKGLDASHIDDKKD